MICKGRRTGAAEGDEATFCVLSPNAMLCALHCILQRPLWAFDVFWKHSGQTLQILWDTPDAASK